jgi:hypothetical protein
MTKPVSTFANGSSHNHVPADGAVAYRGAWSASDNPNRPGTREWVTWDADFWAEHDASFVDDSSDGIESGYGNWYDTDAVSQGMYDDDPSPYDGNYSEM